MLDKTLPQDFTAGFNDQTDLFSWYASFPGPIDTVYEGTIIEMLIKIP